MFRRGISPSELGDLCAIQCVVLWNQGVKQKKKQHKSFKKSKPMAVVDVSKLSEDP
jgi:hypothetical protein